MINKEFIKLSLVRQKIADIHMLTLPTSTGLPELLTFVKG